MSASTTQAPAGSSGGLLRLLGRLGGMLLHPRTVLEATLREPGRTGEAVLVAALLIGLAARPFAAARAFGMFQVSILAGLQSVVGVLAATVLWEVVAIALLSFLLGPAARRGGEGFDSDAVYSAAMLTLMPYLALLLLGAALRQTGVERLAPEVIALLPHQAWRPVLFSGDVARGLLKAAVAHLPTVLLLGWLTIRLGRRRTG